ncbi:MAG: PKD domain-containing protein [Candidatus Kapaibacterium sp.]
MLQKRLSIAFLGCFIMTAFQACVTDTPAPPPKELKLGDSTNTNTIVVPVGGGSFYFNLKDTAHSALIIFPANSYSSSKTVTLKSTPITGSSFGDNVNPASALYTFDAGSDISAKDIIISIPFVADTSKFSMAFFYDLATFELEGVPTIGYNPKSKPTRFSITTRRSGSIFISSIAKSKLGTASSSSFDPAKDNWEFPNYPTLITPAGQFAGQTMSAIWYYYEKALKGSTHLYGTFDSDHGGEGPKIWQDNDLGLRVAAETQKNLAWDKNALQMISPLNNGNAVLTYDQVLYSMMVTGKPQIITVIKDSTVLPLIVYRAENNTLYVADPNYPFIKSSNIKISNNSYVTTTSGLIGESIFSDATYIGVRAMIDWDAIGNIWTDAQNNVFTAFPKNSISLQDASGNLTPAAGSYVTIYNTITLNVQGQQPSFIRIYQNGGFSLYDPAKGIALKQGSNQIGILLQNLSADQSDSLWSGYSSFTIQKQTFAILPSLDSTFIENDVLLHTFMGQKPTGSLRYEWDMGDGSQVIKITDNDTVKHRYTKLGTFTVTLSIYQASSNSLIGKETSTVTVAMNPVAISPIGINGIANIPYVFYGIINLPKDISQRCEWSMGDGSAMKSIIGFDTIPYAFQNAGTFTIKLNIFDNATNVLLGSAQGVMNISQVQLPTLAQLNNMKFFNIQFIGIQNYSGDGEEFLRYYFGGFPTWNYTLIYTDSSKNIRVNPSRLSIDTFDYSETHGTYVTDPNNGRFIQSTSYGLELAGFNIPLSEFDGDTLTYLLKGESVRSHLSHIYFNASANDRYKGPGHESYVSTNWQNVVTPPQIIIKIYK